MWTGGSEVEVAEPTAEPKSALFAFKRVRSRISTIYKTSIEVMPHMQAQTRAAADHHRQPHNQTPYRHADKTIPTPPYSLRQPVTQHPPTPS